MEYLLLSFTACMKLIPMYISYVNHSVIHRSNIIFIFIIRDLYEPDLSVKREQKSRT